MLMGSQIKAPVFIVNVQYFTKMQIFFRNFFLFHLQANIPPCTGTLLPIKGSKRTEAIKKIQVNINIFISLMSNCGMEKFHGKR